MASTLRSLTVHLSELRLDAEVLAELTEQRRALQEADDTARSADSYPCLQGKSSFA
ncbi:hypothetical protein ACIHCX_26810 [Streptomyces sp. NPDC052043]|uniref:hypothetical protein n=1 Tax=Streptomyces sp. NPDC052043 TaxID=3365684 RepID=UPI0037D2A65F